MVLLMHVGLFRLKVEDKILHIK